MNDLGWYFRPLAMDIPWYTEQHHVCLAWQFSVCSWFWDLCQSLWSVWSLVSYVLFRLMTTWLSNISSTARQVLQWSVRGGGWSMEGDWWTGAYLGVSINGGAPISGNLHLMLFAYYNWKVGYHRAGTCSPCPQPPGWDDEQQEGDGETYSGLISPQWLVNKGNLGMRMSSTPKVRVSTDKQPWKIRPCLLGRYP